MRCGVGAMQKQVVETNINPFQRRLILSAEAIDIVVWKDGREHRMGGYFLRHLLQCIEKSFACRAEFEKLKEERQAWAQSQIL